jgi:hypothetical protein
LTLGDLIEVLAALSSERPLFHSEADFQHAFAWQVHARWPDAHVRLETRPLRGEPIHLDVLVVIGAIRVAFELKYLVRALDVTVAGERFELRNHGAHDVRRYDVVKDIARVERLVSQQVADVGYVVVLANDAGYWNVATKPASVDAAFRLHEGARLVGARAWSREAGAGTTRGRVEPIELVHEHVVGWHNYSRVDSGPAGQFRYLAFEVRAN